ncbi:MAG: secondary thiamine-phosphate synthase enzyme YjbQ [Spirochaetes bacterium]|nr:secondary thiamine-phosphate synthase enzyme YjbQ [Spirochaetota bacterium]
MVKSYEINLTTKGRIDVINIQDNVHESLRQSGLKNGTLTVFVPGSTGALSTVEYEPGLVKDIKEFFDKLVPYGKKYAHHDTWHDDNGSSHLQATLMGPSITIPVVNGQLTLGTWQQPIFIDFDTRGRNRRLVIQIMGD